MRRFEAQLAAYRQLAEAMGCGDGGSGGAASAGLPAAPAGDAAPAAAAAARRCIALPQCFADGVYASDFVERFDLGNQPFEHVRALRMHWLRVQQAYVQARHSAPGVSALG